MVFPARGFFNHKSKMTGDYSVFKFLQRNVNVKHLTRFQSDTFVFKSLRRSVDRAWVKKLEEREGAFL